jgi:hypothetical protein
VNDPEEQEFSLEKSKFQQILGSGYRLHRIFSSFQIFLAGQQSKLAENFKNSALNMFLVVNEPEKQEFSLKTSKFKQILGSGWRLHGSFSISSFQIFLAGQQSKHTEKLQNSALNMFLVETNDRSTLLYNQHSFGFWILTLKIKLKMISRIVFRRSENYQKSRDWPILYGRVNIFLLEQTFFLRFFQNLSKTILQSFNLRCAYSVFGL